MGSDLRVEGSLMRQVSGAGKEGGWTSWKMIGSEVEQLDEDRKGMAQLILQKSTDFLRIIVAPNGGVGGVTFLYVCLHCQLYPLGDYIWKVSSGRGDAI